jgi:hypothetical protein
MSTSYKVTTRIPYCNFIVTFADESLMRSWVYLNTAVRLPTCPEAAFLGTHKTRRNEGEVIVEAVR